MKDDATKNGVKLNIKYFQARKIILSERKLNSVVFYFQIASKQFNSENEQIVKITPTYLSPKRHGTVCRMYNSIYIHFNNVSLYHSELKEKKITINYEQIIAARPLKYKTGGLVQPFM